MIRVRRYFPVRNSFKKSGCLLLLTGVVYFLSSGFKSSNSFNDYGTDSLASKQAFTQVYSVLMSPRCMNCHPAGDVPLIGEDSQLHQKGAKRGKDGKGLYAARCSNCHGDANEPGLHTAPGNPNWHLPSANMKMVFQGKTARQLAAQLLDTAMNGHKTTAELVKHVSEDGLVLGGWNPGEGRKLPPMTHEAFVQAFKTWINNGAYLPEQ
jgi:hypothetical protein